MRPLSTGPVQVCSVTKLLGAEYRTHRTATQRVVSQFIAQEVSCTGLALHSST